MPLSFHIQKALSLALLGAWFTSSIPASAQETLPDGYSYIEEAVPLMAPGVALKPPTGFNPQDLLMLDGELLRADEAGTVAEVKPSIWTKQPDGSVGEKLIFLTDGDDPVRILIITPGEIYQENAFVEYSSAGVRHLPSSRLQVLDSTGVETGDKWYTGCYTFLLPRSGDGQILSHRPSKVECQSAQDGAVPINPEERDQGSYWIAARDAAGVATPVLVVQPSNAPINFEQERVPDPIDEPTQPIIEGEMVWSFLRVQGLADDVLPEVDMVAFDEVGAQREISLELLDIDDIFGTITSPAVFHLSKHHMLVALPEAQVEKDVLDFRFRTGLRYTCDNYVVSAEVLARDLDGARSSPIEVSCRTRPLEFTVLHHKDHTVNGRTSSGDRLVTETGAPCRSSGFDFALADHLTTTCMIGAEPGAQVTLNAEAAGFEVDPVRIEITDDNAFGGQISFNPNVRPNNRYLAIAVDFLNGIDPKGVEWESVVTVSGSSVQNIAIQRQDETGLLLRLRFEKDLQEIWRNTTEIVLLFTLDDPSIELGVLGASLDGGDAQIRVPFDKLFSAAELPRLGTAIAESPSTIGPRLSLSSANIALPREFSLFLKIPSNDGAPTPSLFCDVGISVAGNEVVWLEWDPSAGMPVTGTLPKGVGQWTDNKFALDKRASLYARPSEAPIFAERPKLRQTSEGVCPSADRPFEETTVAALQSQVITVQPRLLIAYFIRSVGSDSLYTDRRSVHTARLQPVAELSREHLVEVRFLTSTGSFKSVFPPSGSNPMPTFSENNLYDATEAPSLPPSLSAILSDADTRRRMYGYEETWPTIVLITSNWAPAGCEQIGSLIGSTVRAESLGTRSAMHVILLDDRVGNEDPPLDRLSERSECELGDAPDNLRVTRVTTWRDGILGERRLETKFREIYSSAFSVLDGSIAN